jgi:hypothetical protein
MKRNGIRHVEINAGEDDALTASLQPQRRSGRGAGARGR